MRFRANSFYQADTTLFQLQTSIGTMNSGRRTGPSPYWTRRTEEEATGDSHLADRYREEGADSSNSMGRKAVVLPFKTLSARMGLLELALCILAMTGVFISILPGFHPREWQASGSDLKTLYASAACFRQHIDAYSFQNIAAVFRVNNVVPPENWYAHAPVYPPFTLATLAPLTFIPMVDSVYLWLIMGTLALACATFSLVRAADRRRRTQRTARRSWHSPSTPRCSTRLPPATRAHSPN